MEMRFGFGPPPRQNPPPQSYYLQQRMHIAIPPGTQRYRFGNQFEINHQNYADQQGEGALNLDSVFALNSVHRYPGPSTTPRVDNPQLSLTQGSQLQTGGNNGMFYPTDPRTHAYYRSFYPAPNSTEVSRFQNTRNPGPHPYVPQTQQLTTEPIPIKHESELANYNEYLQSTLSSQPKLDRNSLEKPPSVTIDKDRPIGPLRFNSSTLPTQTIPNSELNAIALSLNRIVKKETKSSTTPREIVHKEDYIHLNQTNINSVFAKNLDLSASNISNNVVTGPDSAPFPPAGSSFKQRSTSGLSLFTDFVTHSCEEYGFVGPDVFFQMSSVVGNFKPRVGDKVVVEAEPIEGMRFKWNGTKVRLVDQGLPKVNPEPKNTTEPSHYFHDILSVRPAQEKPSFSFTNFGNVLQKPQRNPPPPPSLSNEAERNKIREAPPRSKSRSPSSERLRERQTRRRRSRSLSRGRRRRSLSHEPEPDKSSTDRRRKHDRRRKSRDEIPRKVRKGHSERRRSRSPSKDVDSKEYLKKSKRDHDDSRSSKRTKTKENDTSSSGELDKNQSNQGIGATQSSVQESIPPHTSDTQNQKVNFDYMFSGGGESNLETNKTSKNPGNVIGNIFKINEFSKNISPAVSVLPSASSSKQPIQIKLSGSNFSGEGKEPLPANKLNPVKKLSKEQPKLPTFQNNFVKVNEPEFLRNPAYKGDAAAIVDVDAKLTEQTKGPLDKKGKPSKQISIKLGFMEMKNRKQVAEGLEVHPECDEPDRVVPNLSGKDISALEEFNYVHKSKAADEKEIPVPPSVVDPGKEKSSKDESTELSFEIPKNIPSGSCDSSRKSSYSKTKEEVASERKSDVRNRHQNKKYRETEAPDVNKVMAKVDYQYHEKSKRFEEKRREYERRRRELQKDRDRAHHRHRHHHSRETTRGRSKRSSSPGMKQVVKIDLSNLDPGPSASEEEPESKSNILAELKIQERMRELERREKILNEESRRLDEKMAQLGHHSLDSSLSPDFHQGDHPPATTEFDYNRNPGGMDDYDGIPGSRSQTSRSREFRRRQRRSRSRSISPYPDPSPRHGYDRSSSSRRIPPHIPSPGLDSWSRSHSLTPDRSSELYTGVYQGDRRSPSPYRPDAQNLEDWRRFHDEPPGNPNNYMPTPAIIIVEQPIMYGAPENLQGLDVNPELAERRRLADEELMNAELGQHERQLFARSLRFQDDRLMSVYRPSSLDDNLEDASQRFVWTPEDKFNEDNQHSTQVFRNSSNFRKFNPMHTCNICHKMGHLEGTCWHNKSRTWKKQH